MNKFLRSAPVFLSAPVANKTSGVIKDVVIIQEGLNKNGYVIDSTFLNAISEAGNAQKLGVKCRFGHPNMCDDALGTYVGRYTNFSLDVLSSGVSCVRADLTLDEVAKSSPKGNIYDYVLGMATNNPDMFGNSICFRAKDESGVVEIGDEEYEVPLLESFLASDLVDSPAATDSLLSLETDYAERLTLFLDENPNIFELVENKPEILNQFFSKYKNYLNIKTNKMSIKEKANKILASIKGSMSMLDTNATDASGTPHNVICEGEKCYIGDTVMDTEGNPAVDGDYTLTDGNLVTVTGGAITEISTPSEEAVEDETPASPEILAEKEALELEIATLKATIDNEKKLNESLTIALEAEKSDHEATVNSLAVLQNDIHEFKKNTLGKEANIPVDANKFPKETSEKSLKEKIAEARESRKK